MALVSRTSRKPQFVIKLCIWRSYTAVLCETADRRALRKALASDYRLVGSTCRLYNLHPLYTRCTSDAKPMHIRCIAIAPVHRILRRRVPRSALKRVDRVQVKWAYCRHNVDRRTTLLHQLRCPATRAVTRTATRTAARVAISSRSVYKSSDRKQPNSLLRYPSPPPLHHCETEAKHRSTSSKQNLCLFASQVLGGRRRHSVLRQRLQTPPEKLSICWSARSHSNLMERNQQARNHTMITHQAVPLYYGRWCALCACKQPSGGS